MFTDTINVLLENNIKHNLKLKITLKNEIVFNYGYQYFGRGNSGETVQNILITVFEKSFSLLADYEDYSNVTATYFIDGKVDDTFNFYLNGNHIHHVGFGYNGSGWSEDLNPAYLKRGQDTFNILLNKKDNVFSIKIHQWSGPWYGEVFSSSIKITTLSK